MTKREECEMKCSTTAKTMTLCLAYLTLNPTIKNIRRAPWLNTVNCFNVDYCNKEFTFQIRSDADISLCIVHDTHFC